MIPSLIQILNKEKRKRIQLPISLLIIGLLLILLPFLSLGILALRENGAVLENLGKLNWFQIVLTLLPLPIGIGLLRVKKLAWYSLVFYGIIIILWNTYTSIFHPSGWNSFALVESIVFFVMVLYFLKKDISSPYFKLYPRGWRGERRYPIHIPISVNGELVETIDLSLAGFYCIPSDLDQFGLNQQVSIRVPNQEEDWVGGVVRVDGNGVGIAFRNLTKKSVDKLSEIIKQNIVGDFK